MKYIAYILLCFLLLACGQEKKAEKITSRDTAQQIFAPKNKQAALIINPNSIATIKQAYAATINLLQTGQLDSVSYKYNCQQERGGKISYYSSKGKLVMIKHLYNEYSHFEATDEYFIADNQLYFAYLNRLSWSFVAGGGDGNTKDDITESRLYLVNNQAIQCLEKKYTIRKNTNDNPAADQVPNKIVNCKPVDRLLKDFNALLLFKDKPNKDCLEK